MPEPRSLIASSSSTWDRPAELFIAISIRTARSSPGSIVTWSIAAAEIVWMLGRRASNLCVVGEAQMDASHWLHSLVFATYL
jgi:hypothetical protein